MTSPNFRPEDVKVGSRILCSDSVVREVQSKCDSWCVFTDSCGMFLGDAFPASMELVEGRQKERGPMFLGEEIIGSSIAISDGKVVTNVELRLTAIEERLTKLEGSSVKVEYSVKNGLAIPTGSPLHHNYGKNEPKVDVACKPEDLVSPFSSDNNPQSPKVCPVSGMFVEEPVDGQEVWRLSHYDAPYVVAYEHVTHYHLHVRGEIFATREDAERYAKHLKAMAKLRRLGVGGVKLRDYMGEVRGKELCIGFNRSVYNQFTPEEQNALMWPNEEK